MSCSLLLKWTCQRQVCLRQIRCFSNQQKSKPPSPSKPTIYARKFVKAYEGVLKKHLPKFYTKYSKFKFCLELFMLDFKEYRRVNSLISKGGKMETLSRKELVLLRQMPRDFSRALPVFIICVVPFGIYFLPLLFFLPKRFLPSQFSDETQKMETALHYHYQRLKTYPQVINYMEKKLKTAPKSEDVQKLHSVIAKIYQTKLPSVNEVISLKPLFEVGGPLELDKLGGAYRGFLMHSMGFGGYYSPIETQARIMLLVDKEMLREGTSKLTDFEVIEACFQRGINPIALSRQQRIKYLTDWMALTKHFDTRKENISMMLHSCTLLGAGHQSNRVVKKTS